MSILTSVFARQKLDCLSEQDRMIEMGAGSNKVFIDINGKRSLPAVLQAVSAVARTLAPDVR